MVPESPESTDRKDISPAIPLEISAELAASVDELLLDFAEGAEKETALVVERSGALVSGISAEAEVMVDIISALDAGASAAMNALVAVARLRASIRARIERFTSRRSWIDSSSSECLRFLFRLA